MTARAALVHVIMTSGWALVACSHGVARAPAAPDDPDPRDPPTVVSTFAPAVPAGVTARSGACWTQSIAAERADAWRCAIGDGIYDPCFSIAGRGARGDVVLCGANPATGARGFPLRLDAPLPARTPSSVPARPWLLLLADGEVCAPFTGTRPRVGGVFAELYCSAPSSPRWTSLVTRVERGVVWRAAVHAPNGPGRLVAVRRAWM